MRQNVSSAGLFSRHALQLIAFSNHRVDTPLFFAFVLPRVVVPGLTEGGRLLLQTHAPIVAADLTGQLIVAAARNQVGTSAHVILAAHVRRLVVCLMDAFGVVLGLPILLGGCEGSVDSTRIVWLSLVW